VGVPDRVNDLKNDKRLRYVLLFKNEGEAPAQRWSIPIPS